jgi:hypothetical protein
LENFYISKLKRTQIQNTYIKPPGSSEAGFSANEDLKKPKCFLNVDFPCKYSKVSNTELKCRKPMRKRRYLKMCCRETLREVH